MHTAYNTVIEQLTISRLPDICLTHMPFLKRVTLIWSTGRSGTPTRGRSGFAADFENLDAASAKARSLSACPESGAAALPISYNRVNSFMQSLL